MKARLLKEPLNTEFLKSFLHSSHVLATQNLYVLVLVIQGMTCVSHTARYDYRYDTINTCDLYYQVWYDTYYCCSLYYQVYLVYHSIPVYTINSDHRMAEAAKYFCRVFDRLALSRIYLKGTWVRVMDLSNLTSHGILSTIYCTANAGSRRLQRKTFTATAQTFILSCVRLKNMFY